MRGIDGAAARQYPDELEIGEGKQYREGHHNGDNRSKQRIGDVTKHLPAARPIDRCGLVQGRRYRLQSSKQRDCNERDTAPDVRENHRPTRVPEVAKKVDVGGDQSKLPERPRDDRKLTIVDPPKRDGREHGWHYERNQDHRADDRLERHVLVEQQREIEADREFADARYAGIEQRIEDREPEDGVVPQPLVILEPDKNARTADARVRKREPDAEPERIGQKQQQERRSRNHEPETEPLAVYLQPLPRGDTAQPGPRNRLLECKVGHNQLAVISDQ